MPLNKKSYMKKQIKILILSITILFLASLVKAGPSNTPVTNNIPLPITQAPISQVKNGGLTINQGLFGNFVTPTFLAVLTSGGSLGIKMPATSQSADNPTESLDVRGQIRLSDFNLPNRAICANSLGLLIDCLNSGSSYTFMHTGGASSVTKEFTIPSGVTKVQVELFGAGGAGQIDGLTSPSSTSRGGSAILRDYNNVSIAEAIGGFPPLSPSYAGGAGGSTDVNSSYTAISGTPVQNSGSSGGTGLNPASSYSLFNFNCGANYSVIVGARGGLGGYGGKSYPSGTNTPGGNGGRGGFSLEDLSSSQQCFTPAQILPLLYKNGLGYLSEGGITGYLGSGGSGAGGIGGDSTIDPTKTLTQSCYDGGACASAEPGASGGGGGGYIKLELNVSSLPVNTSGKRVLKMDLGKGGVVSTFSIVKPNNGCLRMLNNVCLNGSYSGNGSPSTVIIKILE